MDESPTLRPLLPWRTRPFPVDWEHEFGGGGELHLEIGFGDGRFTARRAVARPDAHFVGLEISSASVQRALRRVKRASIANVRLVKVGAQFALRQLFAPDSLSGIVVNFPDPWPKERHADRRLLQRDFFRLAASRLHAGGALCLATDHPDYLAFSLEQAELAGAFEAVQGPPPPAVFETKYALKWKEQGKPLHYVEFRYDGGPTDAYPPLERPTTMPHALLSGTLPASAPFDKVVLAYGEGHVILHEVARRFGGADDDGDGAAERWWVRASVDEPDLRQHLLVLVRQRSADEVIVRLEPFGDPVITPTVRGAVHAVTEWLRSATDLTVAARNY